MPTSSLEKKAKKTITGLESLFKSLFEKIDSTKTVKSPKAKKGVKAKVVKAKKATTTKAGGKRGRRAGGGLKEAIVDICSGASNPLTEADIAKKLLEDQAKYKWNKNESTLYQTLRRAVKENLISDSGRDKNTKTYRVA